MSNGVDGVQRNATKVSLLVLAGLLGLVALAGVAGANTSENSCSQAVANQVLDARWWNVRVNTTALVSSQCELQSSPPSPWEVPTGSEITFTCAEFTSGAAPPAAATTLTIKAYPDNAGFPNGAGQAWSQTISGASCATPVTFTKFCTVDGTSGGAKRWGSYRLVVHAQRTTIATYDVHSDDTSFFQAYIGVYRCNPVLTSLADALSGGSVPSVYQGGDTLRTTATTESVTSTAGNVFTVSVTCATTTSAGRAGTSSTVTFDATVQTPAFTAGCDLLHAIEITQNSLVTGWTGEKLARWHAVPADVTLPTVFKAQRDIPRTVSYAGSWDGVLMSKTSGGANVSSFVIGADQEFARALGLRDPRGDLVSGVAATCQRTRPDLSAESAASMGTTDASGNTNTVEFGVVSPAGIWRMACTATFNGNTATYVVQYGHLSPLTSDINIALSFNLTNESGQLYLNVTALTRTIDPGCLSCVVQLYPDDGVRLTVAAFNTTVPGWTNLVINNSRMVQITQNDGVVRASFFTKFAINHSNMSHPVYAWVAGNLTSRPFLASASYFQNLSAASVTTGSGVGNEWFNDTFSTKVNATLMAHQVDKPAHNALVYVGFIIVSVLFGIASAAAGVAWPGLLGGAVSICGALLLRVEQNAGAAGPFLQPIMWIVALVSMLGAFAWRR